MVFDSHWLQQLERPTPYQPGAVFWTDPYIAAELLKAHLQPDTDAASYKPETITAICRHLQTRLAWAENSAVADLGCGPGLYCYQLAKQGVAVTGIDQSENSLRYAQDLCKGTNANFRRASYLEPFGESCFDAAMMVSQDYGVLSPVQRQKLLGNIYRALKPHGYFVMDVSASAAYAKRKEANAATWQIETSGLWRPHPYVLLHTAYLYPEMSALCDLYAVLDETDTIYRIWQTFFSPKSITAELEAAGFKVESIWSDLTGKPWQSNSPVLGILCRKCLS